MDVIVMLTSRFLLLFGLILVMNATSRAADLVLAPEIVWDGKGKPKKDGGDPPRPKPAPGPREGGDED
jgi:hypothetical protein